jgi:phosphate starvation-inducible PhoH-like protein
VAAHNDPTQTQENLQVEVADLVLRHMLLAPNGLGRLIEAAMRPYRLSLAAAGEGVLLAGDSLAVKLGAEVIERIIGFQNAGRLDNAGLRCAVSEAISHGLRHDLSFRLVGLSNAVRPMSLSQVAFMNTLLHTQHQLILGIGPTGTGKTHLALAAGLNALALGRVKILVATRPHLILEGEVITESIRAETSDDFQLRPIEDELHALLGPAEVRRLKEREQLEILPLGRMRGRTFNDAFIVIDEAQNMTVRKMRMALSRLGLGSRIVVTGDPTQIDLHEEEPSGLPHLINMIADTDIALVHEFQGAHIIRSDVVARLEALYERAGMAGVRAA